MSLTVSCLAGTASAKQRPGIAAAASKQRHPAALSSAQPQQGSTRPQPQQGSTSAPADVCTPVAAQLSYHTVAQPLQDASNLPHSGSSAASLRQYHAPGQLRSTQLPNSQQQSSQLRNARPHSEASQQQQQQQQAFSGEPDGRWQNDTEISRSGSADTSASDAAHALQAEARCADGHQRAMSSTHEVGSSKHAWHHCSITAQGHFN